MTVSSLGAATVSLATPKARPQGGEDAAKQDLQKTDQQIGQQRELAAVQLSLAGKLKSSIAEMQTASSALSDIKLTDTEAGIRKMASNFVRAFNKGMQTAGLAAAQSGAAGESGLARAAESDLRLMIDNNASAVADLKKAGITRQTDGTLTIDTKIFDAVLSSEPNALRSALSRVGQQVDGTAARGLTNNDNLGNPTSSLDSRASPLENRQTEQQAVSAAIQQTANSQMLPPNDKRNAGIAAYERVFSL